MSLVGTDEVRAGQVRRSELRKVRPGEAVRYVFSYRVGESGN